jgi:hypothetical protein
MPHRRVAPSGFARRCSPRLFTLACVLLFACRTDRDASLTVVLDSNPAHEAREVIAVPVDPASLLRDVSSAPRQPSASDSLLVALQYSVTALDRRFQSAREALNRETLSLGAIDRRTVEYHTRFDAFRKREIAAESLRTMRDRLRERVSPMEARAATKRSGLGANSVTRLVIDTVSNGMRHTLIASADRDTIVMSLPHGLWWLGVAGRGSVPTTWVRAEIPAGTLVDLSRSVPPR